jgi:xanthine/uracil permease
MKRLLLAGIAVFITWTLLDILAHRLLLEPLYESSPRIWRPFSEMNPVLIGAVTVLLIAVFLAAYKALVRPKSLVAGLCLGGLLGAALGASAGFGTYIHSPIPLTLAWGWFGLGTVKGLVAGVILSALIQEENHA